MLREVQAAFGASVLAAEHATARSLLDPEVAPGRLALHRNNTYASLIGVLEAAYPASSRMLGVMAFRKVAAAYVRTRPPCVPELAAYGGHFGAFLETAGPVGALPFLPDLARLEWARNEAYFAAEAEPLDPMALRAVPADQLPAMCFALHPSVRLTRSRFHVLGLWCARTADDGGSAAVVSEVGDEAVLTLRPASLVESVPISPGDVVLLAALDEGRCLASALEHAVAAEPTIDVQQVLADHLMRGTFCAFHADPSEGESR